ncbi:replication initiation negative regulator SeqA [Tolumonas lignilytica]|uniref:replication initiation negative regulator SeqA n=1 Tax=Tolumonas lignilytica TaxID=1283284 RepID=UPI000465DFBB|nr:replication initiation negative regulator SeqA [Tolumonas lignilytica]
MKTIEVDDQIYRYIASRTLHIGESASDILRRLLALPSDADPTISAVSVHEATPEHIGEVSTDVLFTLLNDVQLAKEESAIARFMLILSALYRSQPDAFRRAADIKGRKRIYFAEDPQALLDNGTTTKPKPVPETPYWVITNTNTGRKRLIIEQLMQAMGYSAETIAEVCNKV